MEMLIVVTIIGILAAIILPRFVTSSQAARESAFEAERQTINSQIELFYFTTGSYPTAMDEAGWTVTNYATPDQYWPEGVPTKDVYGIAWDICASKGRILAQGETCN